MIVVLATDDRFINIVALENLIICATHAHDLICAKNKLNVNKCKHKHNNNKCY